MPRVVHFEIHADDPERTAAFYGELFGWRFEKWQGAEDYWLITTGEDSQPGINGGMMRRRGAIDGTAVIGYICSVQVEGIDGLIDRVPAAGGSVVVPKMPIPGVGWLVYCKDPAGNIFGMTQSDPEAR